MGKAGRDVWWIVGVVVGGWVVGAVVVGGLLGTAMNRLGRSSVGERGQVLGTPTAARDASVAVRAAPTVGVDSLLIVAHGLQKSMGEVVGACLMLDSGGAELDEDRRDELVTRALSQAELVSGVLADLIASLPAPVADALDDQERTRSAAVTKADR